MQADSLAQGAPGLGQINQIWMPAILHRAKPGDLLAQRIILWQLVGHGGQIVSRPAQIHPGDGGQSDGMGLRQNAQRAAIQTGHHAAPWPTGGLDR